MKRFKNILYVADRPDTGSAAFIRALDLAKSNQARLTVMDVIEPLNWSSDYTTRFGSDFTSLLHDRRLSELEEMTAPCANEGGTIHTRVSVGTPFLEVIRAVLRDGYDLVIKNAEAPRGLVQNAFGPNDRHLIRKCPAPVWIDRSDRPRPYRKILAAVDPLSDAGSQLDRLIMDLAHAFVAWEHAEVHVVHAWRLQGESILRSGRADIPQHQVEAILVAERKRHASALEKLLMHYDLSLGSARVHFAKSSPTPLIAELSHKLPADLIVMGTAGRTGIPGFFIGNTAESVLQTTDIPVIAVKPAGFVSPVAA